MPVPEIEIRPLDVASAGPAELDDYYELTVASNADWSDEPPESREAIIARLRAGSSVFGPFASWAAYQNGKLVGYLRVNLPDGANRHVAVLRCTVHPRCRRQGIGTALLRAALPELRDGGRSIAEGWHVRKGSVGERWAMGLGFRPVHTLVTQRLVFGEVDPARWERATPAGYRLVCWSGSAPEELVGSYVRAQHAMRDAPRGGASLNIPEWTVERVRAREDELRKAGTERYVVAAVHEDSGVIAGFTVVDLRAGQREVAVIEQTAVLAEHRRHGIGVVLKARQSRWLRETRPDLNRVMTATAASNTHMIRVNGEVGYATTRTTLVLSTDLG